VKYWKKIITSDTIRTSGVGHFDLLFFLFGSYSQRDTHGKELTDLFTIFYNKNYWLLQRCQDKIPAKKNPNHVFLFVKINNFRHTLSRHKMNYT